MTRKLFENLLKVFVIILVLAPVPIWSQEVKGVGVAVFSINGPADLQYLSRASQDAVVGTLLKNGKTARAVPQNIDPDKLHSTTQGKGKDAVLLTGRINIVGQTYRVFLKWIDEQGRVGQEYLELADLNQLLPQLEAFATSKLRISDTVIEEKPLEVKHPEEKVTKVKAPKEKPVEVSTTEALAPAVPPDKTVKESKKAKPPETKPGKTSAKSGLVDTGQDFTTISQRLPYEVRAMAYGDVNGDGQEEVLLTGQSDLYVYRLQGGNLEQIARYAGKKLDNFVKVGIWPLAGSKPYIVLTNLRGDQVESEILRLEGTQFSPVIQNIPYQLRVVKHGGDYQLLGETYFGKEPAKHQILELQMQGDKLKVLRKMPLPFEVGLYSFDYLPTGSEYALAALLPSGKLKLYKEDKEKLKAVWTSKEAYGGSANDVEVKVKNFFNETVADYYIVPLGLQVLDSSSFPQFIVAKNDALLKEILGRKPVMTDGRMVKLNWNPMGAQETWSSQKVDGSIMDYQINSVGGQTQLMVAIRMRDQGFFEGIGRKDSVLLVYNLN